MDMALADSFRTSETSFAPAALPHGRLQLLTTEELADPAFVTAWERLVARAAEPNPFFEPWFLLPALRQWGAAVRCGDRAPGKIKPRRNCSRRG